MQPSAATAPRFQPGESVGPYRIDRQLGEGGFGAIYQATHSQHGHQAALKVLLPEAHDVANARERFEREAQLVHQLQHPNIVRYYDWGWHGEMPYMALELLPGWGLDRQIAERGAMTAERVAHVAGQVLEALAVAHDRGVVHRDIKPANIFLCDAQDTTKLLDFGIAKVPASPGASIAQLTQMGFAVGTPAYMAPEQVLGKDVAPPTDLYALGLVMAEALTGQVVVTGTHDAQVALTQASKDPVKLPPEVLRSPLGPVILKAVHKDASRRYATAAEMKDALAQAASGATAPADTGAATLAGSAAATVMGAGLHPGQVAAEAARREAASQHHTGPQTGYNTGTTGPMSAGGAPMGRTAQPPSGAGYAPTGGYPAPGAGYPGVGHPGSGGPASMSGVGQRAPKKATSGYGLAVIIAGVMIAVVAILFVALST